MQETPFNCLNMELSELMQEPDITDKDCKNAAACDTVFDVFGAHLDLLESCGGSSAERGNKHGISPPP